MTAPMEFRDELIKGLDDMLWMRQICRSIGSIGAGQSLGYPYRAAEATDAEWVGEVAAVIMRYSSKIDQRCRIWREDEGETEDPREREKKAYDIIGIDNVEDGRRFFEIKIKRMVVA